MSTPSDLARRALELRDEGERLRGTLATFSDLVQKCETELMEVMRELRASVYAGGKKAPGGSWALVKVDGQAYIVTDYSLEPTFVSDRGGR